MKSPSFEQTPASHERSIRTRLERLHEMILDTKAEIAQVKEDAIQDPGRTKEIGFLTVALNTLESDESTLREELDKDTH